MNRRIRKFDDAIEDFKKSLKFDRVHLTKPINQKIEKAKAEIERQKALIKDYEDEIINIQQQ